MSQWNVTKVTPDIADMILKTPFNKNKNPNNSDPRNG